MPLPLIPIIIGGASAIAAGHGIKKGVEAKRDMDLAKSINNDAQAIAKQAEESPLQDTAMRESLYHNLTDNEKIQLLRLLDKIVDSGEAESAAEAASEKPVTPFTLMAEGMTCGPDGCCF